MSYVEECLVVGLGKSAAISAIGGKHLFFFREGHRKCRSEIALDDLKEP